MSKQFFDAWQKYVDGDRSAFGQFYEALYQRIVLFCLGILKDEESAKNVTSETFLKLLEKPDPQGIDNPLSWLYTVSKNSCLTHTTTIKRRSFIPHQWP